MVLDETEKSDVQQGLDRLDEAIKAAEDCLKAADESINHLLERRGTIAVQVQHLWNLRHKIKQAIENNLPIPPHHFR